MPTLFYLSSFLQDALFWFLVSMKGDVWTVEDGSVNVRQTRAFVFHQRKVDPLFLHASLIWQAVGQQLTRNLQKWGRKFLRKGTSIIFYSFCFMKWNSYREEFCLRFSKFLVLLMAINLRNCYQFLHGSKGFLLRDLSRIVIRTFSLFWRLLR